MLPPGVARGGANHALPLRGCRRIALYQALAVAPAKIGGLRAHGEKSNRVGNCGNDVAGAGDVLKQAP